MGDMFQNINTRVGYGRHVLHATAGKSLILLMQYKEAKSHKIDENVF